MVVSILLRSDSRFNHRFTLAIPLLFLGGHLTILTSCASSAIKNLPPPRPPAESLQPLTSLSKLNNPVLLPGDSMELIVEEDNTFNGTYPVREGGYILIPKLGRIQVAGLDRDQAEKHLTVVLQKNQLTKAKVFVELIKAKNSDPVSAQINTPKITVFLTGNVSKPGAHVFPIVNGRSIGAYEALLISGGLSRFGNVGKVEILRIDAATGRRLRSVVDLRPVRDGTMTDPALGDGDIVNVNERVFGF